MKKTAAPRADAGTPSVHGPGWRNTFGQGVVRAGPRRRRLEMAFRSRASKQDAAAELEDREGRHDDHEREDRQEDEETASAHRSGG